jgi:hypothetical protein
MLTKNQARAAGFALRVVFATVTGQPQSLAQVPERPVKVADGAEAGVRMETLSLQRRDGGVLTIRVPCANSSDGEVKQSALPGKGSADNLGLHN